MFRKRLRNMRIFKRMAIFGGVKGWVLGEDEDEDEAWVELGWPLPGCRDWYVTTMKFATMDEKRPFCNE